MSLSEQLSALLHTNPKPLPQTLTTLTTQPDSPLASTPTPSSCMNLSEQLSALLHTNPKPTDDDLHKGFDFMRSDSSVVDSAFGLSEVPSRTSSNNLPFESPNPPLDLKFTSNNKNDVFGYELSNASSATSTTTTTMTSMASVVGVDWKKSAPKCVWFQMKVPTNVDKDPYMFQATVTTSRSLHIEYIHGDCSAEIYRVKDDPQPLRMKVRVIGDDWLAEECFRMFAAIGVAAGVTSGGEVWHVVYEDVLVPCMFPFCIGRQAIELMDRSWGSPTALLRFTSRGHGGEYTSMSKYRTCGKCQDRPLGMQAPVSHPQMALVRHLAAEAARGVVRVVGAKVQWASSATTTAPQPSMVVSELPLSDAIHVVAPVIALHVFPVRDDPAPK